MNRNFYNYITVISLLLLAIVVSCKSYEKTNNNKLNETAIYVVTNEIESFFNKEDSLLIIPNKDKSLVLYVSINKNERVSPVGHIKFFVYQPTTDSILCKNSYENSKIEWYSNEQLILERHMGIIESRDKSNIKYFLINMNECKLEPYQKKVTK